MTESVVGRRDPAGILGSAWREGRLGHGLLLHGPSLGALEELCYGLAGEMLGKPDNVLRHPDCSVVRPVNKMRQIGIEPIRSLVRTISHSSNQGGHKVGIILEADRMNLAAANAFLKTLEEPPAETTLFLLSTRPNDLPDTILSRCLAFPVPGEPDPVEHPDWLAWREDFGAWLTRIENPPTSKKEVAETVLRLYGLVQRFQEALAVITTERLEEVSAGLPEESAVEERAAVESGVERGSRRDLLAGVETALRDWVFAREETGGPEEERMRKLVLAVDAVEETSGLLALNFNPVAAVEQLLVRVLRIWSRQ